MRRRGWRDRGFRRTGAGGRRGLRGRAPAASRCEASGDELDDRSDGTNRAHFHPAHHTAPKTDGKAQRLARHGVKEPRQEEKADPEDRGGHPRGHLRALRGLHRRQHLRRGDDDPVELLLRARRLLGVVLLDRAVPPRDLGELLLAEGVLEERLVRLVVVPRLERAAPERVEDCLGCLVVGHGGSISRRHARFQTVLCDGVTAATGRLDPEGDRAVVQRAHPHVRAEPPRLHPDPRASLSHERVVGPLRLGRRHRVVEARAAFRAARLRRA